jgi:hypothetical protein
MDTNPEARNRPSVAIPHRKDGANFNDDFIREFRAEEWVNPVYAGTKAKKYIKKPKLYEDLEIE